MHSLTGLRLTPMLAAAALLAACSSATTPQQQVASNPLVPAAQSIVHSATAAAPRVHGTTKGVRLYVSTPATATVNMYNKRGKLQGQITGFSVPGGIAVDASGNLYVTDEGANAIDVFSPNGTPTKVLSDGSDSPAYIAVGSDGTVYGANITNGAPGSISVWANGSTSPTAHFTDANVFNFHGIALDPSGNVFAAWTSNEGTAGVDEVPAGSSTPKDLGLHGILVPVGLALDRNNALVIADAADENVKVFRSGATFAFRSIGGFSQPSLLAFDHRGMTLYVSDAQASSVDVVAYKSGKMKSTVTAGLSATNYPWGVAVSPIGP